MVIVRILKGTIYLLIIVSLLNSCGVTYKKETLTYDLEKLVSKECNQDSKAYIVGKTLYLDMELDGLTAKDRKTASATLRKIQLVANAVVRVVLSGDAVIKYMVATVYNHDKNLAFRIIQNIDDVKNYFYTRISRSDYESRSLFEIMGPKVAVKIISDKHDISDEEFVGRLIVSQISMLSNVNPFFGALISMLQLRYAGVKNKTLLLATPNEIDKKTIYMFEKILKEKVKDYSKKYNILFNKVEIAKDNGDILFMTFLY
jgi:hypothetical protein